MTDNKAFYYEGELIILQLQLQLEDSIMRMAETVAKEQPCVIICDRGAMDISAYISKEMWQELLNRVGTTTSEICTRYDAVLHLVSAADGAEKYYTTANNAQRYEQANEEGLKLARMLDKKVLDAWKHHSHFRVVDNNDIFERKIDRVLEEISQVLELPLPIKEECKYIVEVVGQLPETIDSYISQTYLVADPDCEVRLRRRTINGHTLNIHTSMRTVSPTERIITERQVSNQLYESVLQQADPYRVTLKKKRHSFIWKGQHFKLDTYSSPHEGLMILETKGMSCHADVKMPPFLRVVENITGNSKYNAYNLAKKISSISHSY